MISQASPTASLPDEVNRAADRLWKMLPVERGGKKPLVHAWTTQATSDPHRLAEWGKQFPSCNWGVVTGSRSRFFVLDVDGEPGGSALRSFDWKGCKLPATLTVVTGGGRHHYFQLPPNATVGSSIRKVGEGLDIKGEGGFVVMPPSLHSNGSRYSYDAPNAPMAEAPEWLSKMVGSPMNGTRPVLPEGKRNDGLTRLAGRLRRRGMGETAIASQLLSANRLDCHPMLSTDEVLKIAASMMRYPIGGPDVLDAAWERVQRQGHATSRDRFTAMVRELSIALPDQPIALPVKRIAEHIRCDWSLVRRHRQQAVLAGRLVPVEGAVAHKRAAKFILRGEW